MDITAISPYVFGAIFLFGAIYLLASLFLGGIDSDIDTDIAADIDTPHETVSIGLHVIAAFCIGMGGTGLIGAFAQWNILLTILVSILVGLVVGRVLQKGLAFVLRQQHNELLTEHHLIGTIARITVDTPTGKTGEALIEEPERIKYAVKNLEDTPLHKGDMVYIESVQAGRLYVRKVQTPQN